MTARGQTGHLRWGFRANQRKGNAWAITVALCVLAAFRIVTWAGTGRCQPLRHPSHPRAWGWRAVQSELGDGIS